MKKKLLNKTVFESDKGCISDGYFITRMTNNDIDHYTIYYKNVDSPVARIFITETEHITYFFESKKYSVAAFENICSRMLPESSNYNKQYQESYEFIKSLDCKYLDLESIKSEYNLTEISDSSIVGIISKRQTDVKTTTYWKKWRPINRTFDVAYKLPKDIDNYSDKTLFYNNNYYIFSNKKKIGFCTSCKKEVSFDGKLKQNEKHVCSSCGNTVTVLMEHNYKKRKYFHHSNTFNYMKKTDKGIAIFFVGVIRNMTDYDFSTTYYQQGRVYIDDVTRKVTVFRFYDHNTFGRGWHPTNYIYTTTQNYTPIRYYEWTWLYPHNIQTELKKTHYEHSGIVEYIKENPDCNILSYIQIFNKFPFIEKFVKEGMSNCITELISSSTDFKNGIVNLESYEDRFDVTGTNTANIMKMKSDEFQMVKRLQLNFKKIDYYFSIKESEILTESQLAILFGEKENVLESFMIDKIRKYMTYKKLANYMLKQNIKNRKRFFDMYLDYIANCKDLKIKLHKSVLLPREFVEEHDKVAELVFMRNSKEYDDQIKKMYSETKDKYNQEIDNLHFLIPSSSVDLFRESEKLKHCVKSFVKRVATKQTLIVFIRRNLDEPFITMEIKDGKIKQIYGYKNEKIPDDIRAVAEKYFNYLKEEGCINQVA